MWFLIIIIVYAYYVKVSHLYLTPNCHVTCLVDKISKNCQLRVLFLDSELDLLVFRWQLATGGYINPIANKALHFYFCSSRQFKLKNHLWSELIDFSNEKLRKFERSEKTFFNRIKWWENTLVLKNNFSNLSLKRKIFQITWFFNLNWYELQK